MTQATRITVGEVDGWELSYKDQTPPLQLALEADPILLEEFIESRIDEADVLVLPFNICLSHLSGEHLFKLPNLIDDDLSDRVQRAMRRKKVLKYHVL